MMVFAKKSLGQNFLQDQEVIHRIVDAVNLVPDDLVIEIGPGRGALTEVLIEKAGLVVGVEFDREMAAVLKQQFKTPKFVLENDDALKIDLAELAKQHSPGVKAKVVGNLPYNISTQILQRLIQVRESFSTAVFMFQKEVVDRLTAKPGNKERGYLTVLAERAFQADHLFDVPPQAFKPVPKVWSSVVRLTPTERNKDEELTLAAIASAAFQQKRKTIENNLKSYNPESRQALMLANIDPGRRAETLDRDEWDQLIHAFAEMEH
jgi:16S rRNA (adenine1518-N6/adenine1519-N6)-dimethyltransferase